LSVQIRKLESEIGAPLFHRGTRGMELTEAGQALLSRHVSSREVFVPPCPITERAPLDRVLAGQRQATKTIRATLGVFYPPQFLKRSSYGFVYGPGW
jgi:hypothetical protein